MFTFVNMLFLKKMTKISFYEFYCRNYELENYKKIELKIYTGIQILFLQIFNLEKQPRIVRVKYVLKITLIYKIKTL